MPEIKPWKPSLETSWITVQIDSKSVDWAQKFGHYLADGLKRDANDSPIQATQNGTPKTKFNQKTQQNEPVWEKQNPLTTSQLRKFFGEIRRIQADLQLKEKFDKTDLLLLKPKLAYQVGREKDRAGKVRDFYAELSKGIDAVGNADDFKRFVKLVEAIVAYHKEKEGEKADNETEENVNP